jgi:beta-galactosidase
MIRCLSVLLGTGAAAIAPVAVAHARGCDAPPVSASAADGGRSRTLFVRNWSFHLGDRADGASPTLDSSRWRTLDLPHDWSIEGDYAQTNPSGLFGAFLPGGIGWYRKCIDIPNDWSARSVKLTFDGVWNDARVYLNGREAARRPNGYLGIDVTLDGLRPGPNWIAVRADNSRQPSARWYTGSGIYRDVWLTVTGKVHAVADGADLRVVSADAAAARVDAVHEVENTSSTPATLTATLSIRDAAGRTVATRSDSVIVEPERTTTVAQPLSVTSPQLWSPDTPHLYDAVFELRSGDRVVDRLVTRTGFRSIAATVDRGFLLNGVPTPIRGMALHQDGGPVGTAVPLDIWRMRFTQLKTMGVNAVRTAHNPFAPEFYALADEMGLMVMDEAFDGWEEPKADQDYGRFFTEWWERDLRYFIRRDRNHPSIVMWSIGNEVGEPTAETQRKLVDLVRSLDPTRPITQARSGGLTAVDVAGLNGEEEFRGGIEAFHAQHPTMPLIGTEITHSLHTRDTWRSRTRYRTRDNPAAWEKANAAKIWERMKGRVYEVPDFTEVEVWPEHPKSYSSSFDNDLVRMPIAEEVKLPGRLPYVLGTFRWTAFDYLGETGGWPERMKGYGVIDAAGFRKGPSYIYQRHWSSAPMVYLDPHWTWPGKEGVEIPVVVYTNLSNAELLLNGRSLGKKVTGNASQLVWKVRYEPGKLRVVASDDAGATVSATRQTAGAARAIQLTSSRATMPADGRSVARIEINLVDSAGVIAPHETARVTVSVAGGGRLIAVENGDQADLDPTKSNKRRAFRGRLAAYIQSDGGRSPIAVRVTARGLTPARTSIAITTTGS